MTIRFGSRQWIGLIVAAVLYLGLSFYQIELPGLHYDEAFEAVPALQLLHGQPLTSFRNSVLTIGRLSLPLMTQDYIGAINTYAALPFMALLGPTPAALRSMSILTGLATLLLTCALATRLTSQPWVGVAAALLLAVDPTFVFWNRQGVFVTGVTATIGVAATYCWLRRFQTQGSMVWSMSGAFLCGLGLYAKLLFVWLIFALIGAALLLNLNRLAKNHRTLTAQVAYRLYPEALAVGAAFLGGCWPLLLYNLQTNGTLLSITQNAGTSYYGVDNLAFGANLLTRLQQFMTLLAGGHLWYLGAVIQNWLPVVFFGGMLVGIVFFATRNFFTIAATDHQPQLTPALFPLLVMGLVMAASIGTVSALWVTHFALLMPWPALALAVGGWTASSAFGRRLGLRLVLPVLVLLVATNLWSTLNYHRALTQSGGLSTHSDAIYDLSEWLETNAGGLVVAMDWGLAAPITYLSGGTVNVVEVFGYQWQPDVQLTRRLERFIARPNAVYLWRAPDEIIFDRSREFKALYRPQQLEETIEAAFYEQSGRPILGVTRLVQQGTAANPPQ